MPWSGKSWTRAIETGISGLAYYLFSRKRNFRNSRSGKAIQLKVPLRSASYTPVPYLTELRKNFVRIVNNLNK